ncbi:uncharacterized protein C15orf65 homolog isoform X1 [Camelus ferus]|uniref:Uncharacterized protein C15orf65 homolog isoform X1 n=2 Tax=Camelus TaxID=9836 RepID=A0A8B7K904_CAMFR|nr:uncharacterized protein C15orf65 homolog isoform X1 [Camelus ferus]
MTECDWVGLGKGLDVFDCWYSYYKFGAPRTPTHPTPKKPPFLATTGPHSCNMHCSKPELPLKDKKSTSASNSDTEMKPEQLPPCVNPGNPVFSCMLDPKTLHTATSLSKPKMIMYKTNSSNYGEFLPMPQFLPCYYAPKDQVFSSRIRATGFYQNNTLNTAPDRTRTLDFPNFQHTL